MALNRKYAALPDLDSAPDIYETPELTDDNSTAPTGTVLSQSGSSDYRDFDEDEGGDDDGADENGPAISRSRLHPDEARERFEPARIDARDVDFSDRVSSKRKSYKASSRRYKRREDGTVEMGDISDDEDGENLQRRLARLKREIEEVKEEAERREREAKAAEGSEVKDAGQNGVQVEDAVQLSRILDSISLRGNEAGTTPSSRLTSALASGLVIPESTTPTQTPAPAPAPGAITSATATYSVTYAPSFQQDHVLAKAAAFDARLTLLESALGIPSLSSSTTNGSSSNGLELLGDSITAPLLPTLTHLQQQISVIVDSSPSSLDAISRRVRTLTQEAEKLTEARRAAKIAQEELRASRGDSSKLDAVESGEVDEDDETTRKINALYGTLPTIEKLAPLLPGVLERLRSLRIVHAEAATAKEGIDSVVKRQEEMAKDIERWKQGIEKLEEMVKAAEEKMGKNVSVVEGWVGGLESKIKNLGG